MIKEENIVFNKAEQLLDIYLPDDNYVKAIFLYFHGGGLECGDKGHGYVFASYLTERNIAVVSADYRMYPKCKFPDFLEDAADAVAWVFNNKSKFGGCENVFVGGSSAGGYITMMLCFDKTYLEKRGISPNKISGFIHDSGQPTTHFNVLKYSGLDSRRVIVDEKAPLFFIGLEESYPPMLFLVADKDMENRYEQTMLVLSTLKHFRYDLSKIKLKVMHGGHCMHCSAKEEDGTSVFGKIIFDYISEVNNEDTVNRQ